MPLKIPPIKSQGIKTKLAPWLAEILRLGAIKPKRWVEPFMGTGVTALNITADEYLLADINPHLTGFYQALQRDTITPEKAAKFLSENGLELAKKGAEHYYAIRDRFNRIGDPLDFLFLNRSCFNGMIRFNGKGEFNVPFCKKTQRFSKAYVSKIRNQLLLMAQF